MCLPLLIFPCTIKYRSSVLAPAHPGGPGKTGRKTVVAVVWCGKSAATKFPKGLLSRSKIVSTRSTPPPPPYTTVSRPFSRDHLGKLLPEENFWTLWCKGRLTEADTPTIRLGATPSGLTSAHLHHPPIFYRPDALITSQNSDRKEQQSVYVNKNGSNELIQILNQ